MQYLYSYTVLDSYTVLYIHTCSETLQVYIVGMVLDRRVTDSQVAELARYLLGNINCVCYAEMFLKIGNIP